MDKSSKSKVIQAGKIASKVMKESKNFIEPGMLLLDIADRIENRIKELGGEPAFPTNLSINEIAAHYTPSYDDETTAHGLLKVDLGVQIDGWIADTAFSLDLETNSENQKLIRCAEECLENALKIVKKDISTNEIGKEIQRTCISNNVHPIVNLTGHEVDKYDLHAGITIPNVNDKKNQKLSNGLYAIEPFVTSGTSGSGKVNEGNPSGIYLMLESKNVRSPTAREILTYIIEEYGSLPFCSRWLVRKFGTKALTALRQLEQQGNLHQFPQLIEKSKCKVAQAEHTVLIQDDEIIITTKENKQKKKNKSKK
ncbi:type II methionyl aminopeptidase [Candidatus Pacearchaeota archaeon]|nr:type II methionyl aminopeptidase [Candidatus Pacearchaeota archaeon]